MDLAPLRHGERVDLEEDLFLLMMDIKKVKVQRVKVFAQLRHGEQVDLEMIDLRWWCFWRK